MFLINKLQQEVETFVCNSKYEKPLQETAVFLQQEKKYKPEMQYPVWSDSSSKRSSKVVTGRYG